MSKKATPVFPMQTRKEAMGNYLCIAGITVVMAVGSGLSFSQVMAVLNLVMGKG